MPSKPCVAVWRLLLSLISLFALSSPAVTFAAPTPIQLGVIHRLQSRSLGESRIINVVLPTSYASAPNRRYPVVYLIDGGIEQDLLHVAGVVQLGAFWGRSAEAIVVGVETRDRRRELVGETRDPDLLKRYPTAGSSGKFRAFIRDEVKPLVETSYRTDGHDIVIGESLAGLFVMETYLVEPSLFDGYAAIDPSLWWDKAALATRATSQITVRQKDHPLFLAFAKEQLEDVAAGRRVVSQLRDRALTYCLVPRPDLTHATIYQQLTPQALQYLLPPFQEPAPEFGFIVQCATSL
jgi:predicted alpha/beta superfamily hydrolase